MEVVGESILSAAIDVVFGKLASTDLLKFAWEEEVTVQLEGWKSELRMIHEVLGEAEEKQITLSSVKDWVHDLQGLAYDMEDVLDEFATELLRRSLMTDPPHQGATSSKVRCLYPSCFSGSNPVSQVKFNIEMGSKIKDITRRLDDISSRKGKLGLNNTVPGVEKSGVRKASGAAATTWQRPPTTSLMNEPVHGRDGDKTVIVEMLLKDRAGESNLEVIPIVGIGGMGKTTLAQFIYRDDKIVKHFEPRLWVCVSDESDVEKLTKMILNAVSPDEIRDGDDFNQVQLKLSKHLAGKRFLLVLDDVWNIKSYQQWNQLRAPLKSGASGSKIVMTTRDTDVASLMRADNYHHFLKPLSNDDCRSVFVEHAFEGKNVDEHPNLKSIGEKIVQKCSGLPLAAKLLGGLLRSKLQVEAWQRVLDSKVWNKNEGGIVPIFRLSYQHLSPHLKRCFAYCALFPRDYEFEPKQLALLWMAEGLIHQEKDDNRQLEDIGMDYFNELLSKCFFQPSSNHALRFVMHDLINELAQVVAGRMYFMNLENICEISKEVRHLSFMRSQNDVFKKFDICGKLEQLRTFMALPIISDAQKKCFLSIKVLYDLVPKMRYLRVLSLSYYAIGELPDSIGNLKHLRYLNLSSTALEWLPETICGLYNLQSLILCNCRKLHELPLGIENLINLRHLDISGVMLLKGMLPQIANLTNLQTLSRIFLSEGNGSHIKVLKNFLNIKGRFDIYRLDHIVDPRDAMYVNLKEMAAVEELVMGWSRDFGSSRNTSNEMKVLEWLQPHHSLRILNVGCYGGPMFPSWMTDSSFSQLEELRLIDCKNCTLLPPVGRLPLLKVLVIEGMNEIKRIGNEFFGDIAKPFSSLAYLKFANMPEWGEWAVPKLFSCLRVLEIKGCPKLSNLPDQFSSLVKLHVEECQELTILTARFPFLMNLTMISCKAEMLESRVVDAPSLTHLFIGKISKPHCLWEGLAQSLINLKDLWIDHCDDLECLRGLENLGGLRQLWILNCDGVVSLEEQGLPSNLPYLYIENCAILEKLPNALHTLTFLTDLVIEKCPGLVSFPDISVPPMLRLLVVKNCVALETLPDGMMSLENLRIEDCPSVIGFLKGELPTTLKGIFVQNCEKLESLPEGIMLPTCRLQRLHVWGCGSLKSIPRGDFPSTLEILSIWMCKQLESIPGKMLENLTSLRHLDLCNCPDVISSPEALLTPDLQGLGISDSRDRKRPLSSTGFRVLTSLCLINIRGPFPEVISLLDNGSLLLPTSLKSFFIAGFCNLQSLASKSLQNLTSLEELLLVNCPKLRYLMPKEGLPPTLARLKIKGCPLLEKKCLKDKGKDWPKIAHIPFVEIDGIVQQLIK